MPYGLLDGGAGALAPAANGVWVAGLGLSPERGGLTFATAEAFEPEDSAVDVLAHQENVGFA